jgi:3-hydroxyisobutyrate dehydrogenase-like beta-hydroxyacid dehydrogenase
MAPDEESVAGQEERRMDIRNIGVVSPGDMGQALAIRLGEAGFAIHAALDGRSVETRQMATAAGIRDCGTLAELVGTCDLIVSVVSPGHARAVAEGVAGAIRESGRSIVFADLNAISPGAARAEEELIRDAGGIFIDGGIIGPPPRGEKAKPRIYASGPDAPLLEQIRHPNLEVRVLSDRAGDASALKMCYAAMTKGVTAVTLELLVAAHDLGVEAAVERELRDSRSDVLDWQMTNMATVPARSGRWVPEMQQIARTFEELGLTPTIFEGAAELYGMVARTPLGHETPEQARTAKRDGLTITRTIAATR